MPENQYLLQMKTKLRVCGVIQIMTGLIHYCLGILWIHLLLSQRFAFAKDYIPLVILSRYPAWSQMFYVTSGIFTIMMEKSHSKSLVITALIMNITSIYIAVLGLFLIFLEFLLHYLLSKQTFWVHESGKLLSEYVLIYTLLEIFVSSRVTHYACKAKREVQ